MRTTEGVIVALFPFMDLYIKVTVLRGRLSMMSRPQILMDTDEEVWNVMFIL